jgi:DNA-binding LytR/AlgR family response regulator
MLKIGICDDDEVFCHSLEEMLMKENAIRGGEISTAVFFDGKSICHYMEQGNYFDVIFLDIEMSELDGVSTGHKIRETLKDEDVQLIYVSSKDSYAMELFELRPMNFLIKPITEEKLQQVLSQAYRLIKRNNVMFQYKINRQFYYIAVKEIQYFEVTNRKIHIYTTQDRVTYYGKLSEVTEQVREHRFLRINRSQLVNYDAVEMYQQDRIRLQSGVELQIGYSRKKEIQKQMLRYAEEDM